MKNKKYYWLRLKENFFNEDDIKILKKKPNGEKYIVFLLQLMLKSINSEGKLIYKNMFPYDDEMLATITDTDIDVVRTSMKVFKALGLATILNDGSIYMKQVKALTGCETKWAEKKRLQRQKGDNVLNMSSPCPLDVRQEKEKEKDIEIDQQQPKIPEIIDSVNKNSKKNKNSVEVVDVVGVDDVVDTNIKVITDLFLKLTRRKANYKDITNIKSVMDLPVAVPLSYKSRTGIILTTMVNVSKEFSLNNPGDSIKSFKYFVNSIQNEFKKYAELKRRNYAENGKGNKSNTFIDEYGECYDLQKFKSN